MTIRLTPRLALVLAAFALLIRPAGGAGGLAVAQPEATAVLAGGCFWGVEAVFEHVRGVRSVTSGYARYPDATSPARIEAVRIVYDPSRLSYRQLLEIFFLVAHDPTSRDRQGPDAGPEYRAVVLHTTPAERQAAEAYIAELAAARRFGGAIVTEVQALAAFSVAEPFHQDYAERHPEAAYVVQNDLPKLARLRALFPALYEVRR